MSNMLADIVTAALAPAPDIVIARAANERRGIAAEVRATRPDAVITQTARPGNGEAFHGLLLSFPALKVIAIASDGSSGFVHQLRLMSSPVRELSAGTLQAALRSGAQPLH
jgi:hypothetical protein